jgi:hypothetical protein
MMGIERHFSTPLLEAALAQGTRPHENRTSPGLFLSTGQAYGGSAPCARTLTDFDRRRHREEVL